MAEIQVVATRISNGKTGSCHVSLARDQVGQHFGNALHGFDDKLDAEVIGERLNEIVLGPGWSVRAINICGGAVARNDTKLADLEDLVENGRRRRTGTEQGRQQ